MTTKNSSIYANAKYENDAAFFALSNLKKAVARRQNSIWTKPVYSFFNDSEEERSETELLKVPGSASIVNNGSEDDCRVDDIEHRKKIFPHFDRRASTLRQNQGHATTNRSTVIDEFTGRVHNVYGVESVPNQQSKVETTKYCNSSARKNPPRTDWYQTGNDIHIQKKEATSEHAPDECVEGIWDVHPVHVMQRQENNEPTNKRNKENIESRLTYSETVPRLTRKDTMEQNKTGVTGKSSTIDGFQAGMRVIKDPYSVRENPVYFNSNALGQMLPLNLEKPLEELSNYVQNYSPVQNLICVKIKNNIQYFEFFTNLSDLVRIKRKFSKFSELLPDVDATHKEMNHSADAVKIIFGFLFNRDSNFVVMSNGRVAVETLAASRSWEMHEFHNEFQEHFLHNILPGGNIRDLYSVACHLGEHEICEAIKNASTDSDSIEASAVRYKQKNCFVSVHTYIESLEFSFPLVCVPARTSSYEDNFNRDIRNEVIFEAISGCYKITGFQILFNLQNVRVPSDCLKIYYSAININEDTSVEEQKNKPLRSKIIIYFKQEVIVKAGQKCKISVEMEVKPFLCFSLKETIIKENTHKGRFDVSMSSTFKMGNSKKMRFFIDKLFYRESNACVP